MSNRLDRSRRTPARRFRLRSLPALPALVLLVAAGLACSSGDAPRDDASAKDDSGVLARAADETQGKTAAMEEQAGEAPAAEETGTDGNGAEPAAGKPATTQSDVNNGAVDEPAEEPAPDTSGELQVKVPQGPVRVAAPKSGLTAVGVDKCKTCHKVQYTSWLETKHAALTPPLDCEACHGPGSEYRPLKVMKDPAAARAAGLVDPSPTFCANCHLGGWTDDMLAGAHAHKEKTE